MSPSSDTDVPIDGAAPEASHDVKGLRDKITKLSADNTRLKNELRFTVQHQRYYSNLE